MHRALGLTPEQAGEVRALHQQHFAEMDGLQQEIHTARLRLPEAIFSVALGEAEIHELADQVGEKWSLLEVNRFEHFKRIEALCDPQQKDRLKTLLEGVLTTVAPPPAKTWQAQRQLAVKLSLGDSLRLKQRGNAILILLYSGK